MPQWPPTSAPPISPAPLRSGPSAKVPRARQTSALVKAWQPKLAGIQAKLEAATSAKDLAAVDHALKELNMSFNLQYLQLQKQMEVESHKLR